MTELKKEKILLTLITSVVTFFITFIVYVIRTHGWAVVATIQFNAALFDSTFYGLLAAVISFVTYWSAKESGQLKKRLLIVAGLIMISVTAVTAASIITAPNRLQKQTDTLRSEKQRAHTATSINECDGMSNSYWPMCINNTLKTPTDYTYCINYQKKKLHDIQQFVCVYAYADNTDDITKCQALVEDYLISGCEQVVRNNTLER